MKTIICGGRDYFFSGADLKELDELRERIPITEVVSGAAPGADTCGENWARSRGIPVTPKPAAWSDITAPGAVVRTRRDGTKYNILAGNWRNQAMADYAEACVYFPGGKGTKDMVYRADEKGLALFWAGPEAREKQK